MLGTLMTNRLVVGPMVVAGVQEDDDYTSIPRDLLDQINRIAKYRAHLVVADPVEAGPEL
jgi:uncharacterized protein YaiL (DUF2058 family)